MDPPVFDADTIIGEEPELSSDSEDGDRSPDTGSAVLAYLLVFESDSSSMFQLPRNGEVIIGRSESAGLLLHDNTVSRSHARLTIREGVAAVSDLGSQNGTRVNGTRISGERVLVSGDIVSICSVSLVFNARIRPSLKRSVLGFHELRARAEEELERALRYNRPLALLTVALGGGRSPEQRQETVASLADTLRLIDIVGWSAGEDELLLLLPETGLEEAELTAERLLQVGGIGQDVRAGVASCPRDGCDVDTLLTSSRAAAIAGRTQGSPRVNVANAASRRIEIGDKTVIVADPAMVNLYDLIKRLAVSDLSVLVHGETGSGKELAARALHHWSNRSKGPLVAINCAAIPENLVESELFGHDKGSFSGASATKIGLLESASGGTVILDEVGELPLAVQAKLLRVLETQKVARIGEVRERGIDIRLVGATNRDLAADAKANRFRPDLFFRLSGATVWLPPLRDRKQDIPVLAGEFLAAACSRANRPPMTISDGALQLLQTYAWPGNVRELKNVIDYAVAAFPDGELDTWHLSTRLQFPQEAPTVKQPLPRGTSAIGPAPVTFRPIEEEIRELERRRITAALEAAGGNQTKAAELIQMPLRTFQAKLKQYDPRGELRKRR